MKLIDNYHRLYRVGSVITIDPDDTFELSSLEIIVESDSAAGETELVYAIREIHLDEVMNMNVGTTVLIYSDRSESLESVMKITRLE